MKDYKINPRASEICQCGHRHYLHAPGCMRFECAGICLKFTLKEDSQEATENKEKKSES